MRITILGVLILCMIPGVSLAEDKVALKDGDDKTNYSIGYQVGADFRRQGIDIAPEILMEGILAAMSGEEPEMSIAEMRTALVDLNDQIEMAKKEQERIQVQKNLSEGKTFLEENSRKEGVYTLPSGLQYQVIKEGKGESPKATDTVTVHYRGTLINGTEFDSSYTRNRPAKFALTRVIKGWTEGLQVMKPGAKYKLFVPPDLAYGESGAGGSIGPNSTLIFEVELLSVNPD